MQQIYTNRKPPKCYFITDYRQLDFLAKKLLIFSLVYSTWTLLSWRQLHCICAHAHLRPTGWNHIDCSPPGSSVHGILQARVLEWSAISPSPRIEPSSLKSPALAGRFFTTSATWEATLYICSLYFIQRGNGERKRLIVC